MRLLRTIVLAAITTATVGILPAAAQTIEAIQQRGKIVIGMDQTIPPYGLTDTNMRPSGYDADVSSAIAQALGVEIEFVQIAGPAASLRS